MKVRPMRSSVKLMCKLIKKFKKHIQLDFVNAMKKTLFGAIFMASTMKSLEVERPKVKHKCFENCRTV